MTTYFKYWFPKELSCHDGTTNHKWKTGSVKVTGKTKEGYPILWLRTKMCSECGLIEELNRKSNVTN